MAATTPTEKLVMSESETHILAKKIDRLIFLVEGSGEDIPGLIHAIKLHEKVLMGTNSDGLIHRVNTMWRVHVWLLCTMSGAAGYMLKVAVELATK